MLFAYSVVKTTFSNYRNIFDVSIMKNRMFLLSSVYQLFTLI